MPVMQMEFWFACLGGFVAFAFLCMACVAIASWVIDLLVRHYRLWDDLLAFVVNRKAFQRWKKEKNDTES